MKVTGDLQAGQEVIAVLKDWDRALCSLDLHEIIAHCSADVSLFDVSTQMSGIAAYQQLWERDLAYLRTGLRVFRDHLNVHAAPDLAFVSCYSKVDVESGAPTPDIPWCRTPLCFRKKRHQWKIVHQHISMPVDMQSGQAAQWRL